MDLAHLAECALSMREARGSIPLVYTFLLQYTLLSLISVLSFFLYLLLLAIFPRITLFYSTVVVTTTYPRLSPSLPALLSSAYTVLLLSYICSVSFLFVLHPVTFIAVLAGYYCA